MILSSNTRPLNFVQNALAKLWGKNELHYLKKISGYVKSGIQILYEEEQFSSLFWGNFLLCNPELIEFRLFLANSWLTNYSEGFICMCIINLSLLLFLRSTHL